GAGEVVVDRLRHADHGKLVLAVEPLGDAERVLAADRDEGVETAVLEVPEHLLDAAVERERIGAARADDRAAPGEDPRALLRAEVAVAAVDEPAPALEHAHAVPAFRAGRADDRADHRVQAGAVAAPCEDADRPCHPGSHTGRCPFWGT